MYSWFVSWALAERAHSRLSVLLLIQSVKGSRSYVGVESFQASVCKTPRGHLDALLIAYNIVQAHQITPQLFRAAMSQQGPVCGAVHAAQQEAFKAQQAAEQAAKIAAVAQRRAAIIEAAERVHAAMQEAAAARVNRCCFRDLSLLFLHAAGGTLHAVGA